ncbi:MAG TPA: riboflavin synthase [Elusimicrobiota bacterium]|nr:riboflavin synthase [Elusimicrobiota bacterium]
MFTGIISVLGKVEKREGARLSIRAKIKKPDLGASIAINGVCLTVVATKNDVHDFEVGPETWSRTSLGALKPGARVNLETSLRMGDELGGHFVSGHVDAPSKILALAPWDKDFYRLRLELPGSLRRFVAEKGSVAVDGISLTVTEVGPSWLEIMLVPHTLSHTNLGGRKTGDRVNLEIDPLARYAVNAARTLRSRR